MVVAKKSTNKNFVFFGCIERGDLYHICLMVSFSKSIVDWSPDIEQCPVFAFLIRLQVLHTFKYLVSGIAN